MRVTIKPIDGVLASSEISELQDILTDEKTVGYSIFDTEGTAVQSDGVGETAIAVFSNIFEQTVRIGDELGEEHSRPSIMFSGRDMELVALPLANANILVVKEKGAGIRREYRNAG